VQVEVLSGVERRTRWSRDEKMRIMEEALVPGAVVTEIAPIRNCDEFGVHVAAADSIGERSFPAGRSQITDRSRQPGNQRSCRRARRSKNVTLEPASGDCRAASSFQSPTGRRSLRTKPAPAGLPRIAKSQIRRLARAHRAPCHCKLFSAFQMRYCFIFRSRRDKARFCVRLFDDFVAAVVQPSDKPISHGVVPSRK
jgi:hypothetical protein